MCTIASVTRTIFTGGRLIDPAAGVDDRRDLVTEEGRIAAVAPTDSVVPKPDDRVVDVTGLMVTPGLIDLHGHWSDTSPYGIDPVVNLAGGVTTAVDAGTTGFSNFTAFRRHTIEAAPVHVLAFLHVAAAGLVTTLVGELHDMRLARPRETAAVIADHRDVIVGVKVRLGTEPCGANIEAALDAALEAAALAGVPLMAHISDGADVRTALERMRPGDILTHAFTASGTGIRGRDGRIMSEAHRATQRGVRFDIGHGCGSFSWEAADQALAEGIVPDAISTDLHRYSIERPVVDLPTTMSRFLALGLSLPEVVKATTIAPATIVGRPDLGSLRVGGPADVTVLRVIDEPRDLPDSQGVRRAVRRRLEAVWTMTGGVLHAASETPIELRPLNDADREVDCSIPI
jgi:dihydroorotase